MRVAAEARGGEEAGRRRLPPEVRRRQILAAAVELFADRGYSRTTTREIARAARVSEGTIFRFFRTKQDILFSFIESEGLATLASMMASPGESDDRAFLEGVLDNRLRLGEEHHKLLRVLIGEALFDPKLADALVSRVMLPASRMLGEYLEGRMKAGALRKVDRTLAVRALVDHFLADTLIWRGVAAGRVKQLPRRELSRGFVSIFLDGMRRPARRAGRKRGG